MTRIRPLNLFSAFYRLVFTDESDQTGALQGLCPTNGASFAESSYNFSMTLIANWGEGNRLGGLLLRGTTLYAIKGSCFEHNGGCDLDSTARNEAKATNITITGVGESNTLHRNARFDFHLDIGEQRSRSMVCVEQTIAQVINFSSLPGTHPVVHEIACSRIAVFSLVSVAPRPSARFRLVNAAGIAFSGDTLCGTRDYSNLKELKLDTSIAYDRLTDYVIVGNSLHDAAISQFLDDRGEYDSGFAVHDNPGPLCEGYFDFAFNPQRSA